MSIVTPIILLIGGIYIDIDCIQKIYSNNQTIIVYLRKNILKTLLFVFINAIWFYVSFAHLFFAVIQRK